MLTAGRLRWAAVGAIVAVLMFFALRSRSRDQRRFSEEESARASIESALDASSTAGASGASADAAAPIGRTVRDPGVRDDVRRRIYGAWSAQGAPNAPAPADPLHAPMPEGPGGGVDPSYVRARIREDFVPMAQVCYESFLTRRPNVAGRVLMAFKIVGDARIGGVIDEATVGDANADAGPEAPGVFDPEFVTCLRESLLTVAFQPPPHSGTLTVRYPITLAPDAPGTPDGG